MDGTAATNIPDFHLPSSTGRDLSLDSFLDKVPLAIVFLSDLESDHALVETLDEALSRFGEQRAQLLVVAPMEVDTLQTYVDDHDLKLPILADASGKMARDFEVLGEGGIPQRTAFVATAEGRMVTRLDDLDEADLVDQLLNEVRDLGVGADVASATEE